MKAETLARVDTIYSADSIEFCPHDPDLFVCGTYQLVKEEQEEPQVTEEEDYEGDGSERKDKPAKRVGRCLVYDVDDKSQPIEIQRFDGPAILDTKWNHHKDSSGRSVLGVADAEGRVVVHSWDPHSRKMEETQAIQVAESSTLVLSLDWSNRLSSASSSSPKVITSLSSCGFALLETSGSGEFEVTQNWENAHDFEPWVASWDYWDENVFYSGGDDCKLKGWDIRQDGTMPTWTNKKFDAGVTCIQSSPHRPNLIAVGSYNSTVSLFDPRYPLRTLVDPIPIGGGAWRVKWHPSPQRKNDLLVACMHDGFKVVSTTLDDQGDAVVDAEVVKTFEGHESLAYGVDWSYGNVDSNSETLVGSASFYDHLMCLWRA